MKRLIPMLVTVIGLGELLEEEKVKEVVKKK